MRNAVVTLSIAKPGQERWIAAGLPSKREYARRIGADFVNITKAKLGGSVAMEKYQIGGMDYDRVLYLDADIVIDPGAPSLFDVVPEGSFGAYDEGRPALYAWLKEGWPDDPCDFYVNNGLFVCGREHKWLFDYSTLNRKLNTYEQTCMSRRLWESKTRMHWLGQEWNYMPRLWINGPPPGWVPQNAPWPCYVYHFPCHRPDEREALMADLNRKYGV